MPRIRTIKPTFWSDEKLGLMPRDVRLTFLGLISALADDHGRLPGNSRIIRGAIYPYDDDVSAADIERHLAILAESGRIVRYKVNGDDYVAIRNWLLHQKVDKPSKSLLPAPPRSVAEHSSNGSPNDRRTLPNERSGAGAERSGNGVGREENKSGAENRDLEQVEAESPAQPESPNGTAPPAPPTAPPASPLAELPAVRDFVRTFYPKASTPPERRKDIAAQLEATLTVGAKHKRQLVHAYSRERLELKCREVMQEGVRDPDKAIVVLLTKLGDTSDSSAPGQRAERRATEERHVEERSSAQDLEHAEAWIASEPEVQSTFAELLTEALELHSMPLGADDELDALQLSARRIVRRNLALMHWRNSGSPIVETAS